MLTLNSFDTVLEDFRLRKMVVLVDDADRENEGDLIIPADAITPASLAFMMNFGRGLICVSIAVDLAERLNLPLQVTNNNSLFQTPFAISIDHKEVVQRGVTAEARALTIRKLLEERAEAADFVSPGHVFPLVASPAGVLGRQGQTEGSYDLARIAGFKPAAVLCEILNEDGTMARGDSLAAFAKQHDLKITSVEEIVKYRTQQEVMVRGIASSILNTNFGEFKTQVFKDDVDGKEHLALILGNIDSPEQGVLTRIHSECLTGDVFGSLRCDCGSQLSKALAAIKNAGRGVLIYLRQEGRGIGLANKLKAYELQDKGHDTVEANIRLGFEPDSRDFAVAAKILKVCGVSSVKLMTNNPEKISALGKHGIEVMERIPLEIPATGYSKTYLETKRKKLGHLLSAAS